MKETHRNRTFSWLESRRPRGTGHYPGRNEVKETNRKRTFRWLASRRPTAIGHSAGWNEGDPEEQNIQLSGMQETQRERIFNWPE